MAAVESAGPEPLKGFSIRIAGHFSDGRGPVLIFEVSDKETVTHYRQYELVAMGYGIANLDNCSVKLTFGKIGRFVSCARARPAKKNTAPLLTANKEGEPAP